LLIGTYILCSFWWSLNTLYHIWIFYCFTENKDLRSLNEKLEYELVELRRKYSRLESYNHEITKKADQSSHETKRLREEIQVLLSINEEFGKENDELQKEVSQYRTSTEEGQKPNKTLNEERRNTSKRRKINKKIVYQGDSESSASGADEPTDEPKEKEARVSKF
jgi:chromosome segregation ATPase